MMCGAVWIIGWVNDMRFLRDSADLGCGVLLFDRRTRKRSKVYLG